MLRSVIEQFEPDYKLGVTTDLKMNEQKDLKKLPHLTFPPTFNDFRFALHKKSVKSLLSVVKRGFILPFAPQWLLQKVGQLNAHKLVALFDCSGFAYGDQWSPSRMISRTKYYK